MNAKKAKALRKQVGFVPSEPREIQKIHVATSLEFVNGKAQEVKKFTHVTKGARHLYQQVKRGRVSL